MENAHMTNQETEHQVLLNNETFGFLRSAAPWMQFIAIVGFVFCGLMVLAALSILFSFAQAPAYHPGWNYRELQQMGMVIGVIYLISAVVMFFPNLFLVKYSRGIKTFLNSNEISDLNYGFKMQKNFWLFVGIMTIIYIGIILLTIILAIFAALML
jgi:amino acid transporter